MHGIVAWVTMHDPCLPACCTDKQSLLRGPKCALVWLSSLTTFLIAALMPWFGGMLHFLRGKIMAGGKDGTLQLSKL